MISFDSASCFESSTSRIYPRMAVRFWTRCVVVPSNWSPETFGLKEKLRRRRCGNWMGGCCMLGRCMDASCCSGRPTGHQAAATSCCIVRACSLTVVSRRFPGTAASSRPFRDQGHSHKPQTTRGVFSSPKVCEKIVVVRFGFI